MRRVDRIARVLDEAAARVLMSDMSLDEALLKGYRVVPSNLRPQMYSAPEALKDYFLGGTEASIAERDAAFKLIAALPRVQRAELLSEAADFLRGGN